MSWLEQRVEIEHLSVLDRSFTETGVIMTVEGPEDTIAAIVTECDLR